jgi:uracil-DNA glycosylase family 4
LSKMELMEKIASEVLVCVKCPLWKRRRNAVPGEGNIDASVVFVGEAPGYWEDMKGLPFVGAAGKILNALLTKIGLLREHVFITNVVKCRPPENRDPQPGEVKTCTSLYLNRQIALIQPKIIVTLGRHSTAYIFSKAGLEAKTIEGITQLHGKVIQTQFLNLPVSVIPMFHPAATLYNLRYREALENDFNVLKNELKKHGA